MTDPRTPCPEALGAPGAPLDAQPPPGCPAAPHDSVPLSGLEFQQTPSQLYRSLRRAHGPIAPVLLDGGVPAWLVLGYSEVSYVTSHDELFARDSRRWNQWAAIPADWPLLPYVGYQPSVLFTEGAEHQRRAGVITQALEAVDQFELAHDCRQIAEQLIDAFAGTGGAELMASYAHALPMRAAVQMCGMPAGGADTEALVSDLRMSLDAAEGDDPVSAYLRVQERIQRLVRDKRVRPGSDVTSRMLGHPAGLADDEIVQDLISVIAAAQQPTANWICNTLRLLLTDDRFALNVSGAGSVSGRRSTRCCGWTPRRRISSADGRSATRSWAVGTSGRATAWSWGSRRPTPIRRSGRRVISARRTRRTCPSATASTGARIRLRCWPTSSPVRRSRRCWSGCRMSYWPWSRAS